MEESAPYQIYTQAFPNMERVCRAYLRWVFQSLEVPPQARILEVGCGIGLQLDMILSTRPELYLATDIYEPYVAIMQEKIQISHHPQSRAFLLNILDKNSCASLVNDRINVIISIGVLNICKTMCWLLKIYIIYLQKAAHFWSLLRRCQESMAPTTALLDTVAGML